MTKAQRTREQIVQAAAALIRSTGPGQVSVAQVMARLELTHGGFYAHFASKDDLVQAALEEAFREVMLACAQVVAGKPPAEALASCIDWYVSADMRDHPERACPLTVVTSEGSGLPPQAQQRLADGATRMVQALEGMLTNIGHPDPAMEAHSVAAAMVGAVSLSRTVADREQSERFLASTRAMLKGRLGL